MSWSRGSLHIVTIVRIKVLFLASSITKIKHRALPPPCLLVKQISVFILSETSYHSSKSTEVNIREESFKEVQFNEHLCNLSPDSFGLSAQLAILKRSLRGISYLAIANRTDRNSQDMKALRTKSTWKEAPKSVRNGPGCCLHFHVLLAGSAVLQPACGIALGGDPAPQHRGPLGAAPPPRRSARTPPRPRAGPAPAPAPPPRPSPPLLPRSRPHARPKLRALPGSARSCSGGRMPSVSVSCYGNPHRGKFRIRSKTEPRAPPDPPLASRPPGVCALRPQPKADLRCFCCGPGTQLRKCQGCR